RVLNGSTETVTATATAVDGNRNVLAGIPITLTVDAGASVEPSGTVTDSKGVVTGLVRIGSNRTNRIITVTAVSGDLTKTANFMVDGAKLFASASPMVEAGSAGNTIEYTLFDSNSVAMVDEPYTVTGAGLPTQSGKKTDANGKFTYTYTAPTTPGVLTVVATAAGAQSTQVVTVSAGAGSVPDALEPPKSASLVPTPSVVQVNSAGSSLNQVELRALFIGADNRPIKNMRARFDLVGGASDTYGRVQVVGNYAYSDESGIARATFVPSTRESPTHGVVVRMCYDQRDFATPAPNSCIGALNSTLATLTVSLGSISVNIRTNNLIKSGINDLTYIKEYVVMVVDSAGKAVSNVEIVPSIDLLGYYKGYYSWSEAAQSWLKEPIINPPPGSGRIPYGTSVGSLDEFQRYSWSGKEWVQFDPVKDKGLPPDLICPNEDWNRNSNIERLNDVNEDLNGNGSLEPRKSDVAIKMVGGSKTNESGIALVQIEYGKDLGSWVDYDITITAVVAGSEARAHYIGTLSMSAAELTAKTPPPSFAVSPYGTASSCADPK
ncbi:MAG: hypothetical protein IT478_17030, partial [Xanthomonadales bacterium]|nr:hypothetical protein [Xanthomonadales bacterium]